jgi:ankyrin repeat protein
LLLAAGDAAAINTPSQNKFGATPLHLLAARGHVQLVADLLAAGALCEVADRSGMSPLQVACRENQLAVVEALLAAGASPARPARNRFGPSALHAAVLSASPAVVTALLRAGVDPNITDRSGLTPLHLAAREGRAAIVETLLAGGAALQPLGGSLRATPLFLAAEAGHPTVVAHLQQAGASLEVRDRRGRSAWHGACAAGHSPVVAQMIEAGADVMMRTASWEGLLGLHLAAAAGHVPVVLLLLAADSDDNQQRDAFSHHGCTALHLACENGHLPVVQALIAAGADLHLPSRNSFQALPLNIACYRGDRDIAAALLAAGADRNLRDGSGRNAFEAARRSQQADIIDLVQAAAAPQDAVPSPTATASSRASGRAASTRRRSSRGVGPTQTAAATANRHAARHDRSLRILQEKWQASRPARRPQDDTDARLVIARLLLFGVILYLIYHFFS